MNILIDIGHPAHVHLFRNAIRILQARGHEVTTTVKDIPSAIKLLELYGIPFVALGAKSDSIGGKLVNQLRYDLLTRRIVRRRGIQVALGSSITIAHVSAITSMQSLVFDDDDDGVQPLMTRFGHPFATKVYSPDVLEGKRRRRDTVYYPAYHELAYLHPNHFQPDPSVLAEAGLREGETFFIMRFNAFKAHHDVGVRGLSLEQKRRLIETLSPLGKVFITTERDIEPELKAWQMLVSPEKAHSLMAYASLFLGDSQTMTSEAAVLGVPSLRCNTFAGRIAYLEEQEKKYGLTFGFLPEDFERLMAKLKELLAMPNLREEWQMRRQRMLADKIDLTEYMVRTVEAYEQGKSGKILPAAPVKYQAK